jgi:hypothetical protein
MKTAPEAVESPDWAPRLNVVALFCFLTLAVPTARRPRRSGSGPDATRESSDAAWRDDANRSWQATAKNDVR